MPNLGGGELIIILIIVIVLFGAGRISRLGGELGTAIREFRKGIAAEDADKGQISKDLPADQSVKPS
ncbi:MAG: twin-arginine translocase TatA/TatE family subunit [Chloroflexota bacterium]